MSKRLSLIRVLLFPVVLLPLGCTFEDLRALVMAGVRDETTSHTVGVETVYIPFENGFMLHIADQPCLYAYAGEIILPREILAEYNSYRYCLPFAELPGVLGSTLPDPFVRVWSRYAEVSMALGDPSGSPVHYRAHVPQSDPVVMGGVFYSGVITLPDGARLYCGTRAATAGSCQLR